jgi:hypothetical protein
MERYRPNTPLFHHIPEKMVFNMDIQDGQDQRSSILSILYIHVKTTRDNL